MSSYHNPLFEVGRIERAKDVAIKFTDSENFLVVYAEDEFDKKTKLKTHDKGDVKYFGIVKSHIPHIDDYCGCQSFYHGNVKAFLDSHGFAFQCKHIIQGRNMRYAGHPELRHG